MIIHIDDKTMLVCKLVERSHVWEELRIHFILSPFHPACPDSPVHVESPDIDGQIIVTPPRDV
jgi:hypothetical protein